MVPHIIIHARENTGSFLCKHGACCLGQGGSDAGQLVEVLLRPGSLESSKARTAHAAVDRGICCSAKCATTCRHRSALRLAVTVLLPDCV